MNRNDTRRSVYPTLFRRALPTATFCLALGCCAEPPLSHEGRSGMPQPDAPDGNFAGDVQERMSAGMYTYMLVRSSRGAEWVVALGGGAPVGSSVDVTNIGVKKSFHSKRLDRTFDRLVFGIVRKRN